ncbi:transposase (fragment) [Xenorhabdus bovienii str. kraussei Quebec]|uniref:Transposase n=1 Tax=Xenorhabdus bovienii str. kraussei Quebec TaxID=1398203 RepID=A0A077PGY9_XENBV
MILTARCDATAALLFFRKAIRQHGRPAVVTIDKSEANTAALTLLNAEGSPQQGIEIRQNKYLNNRIAQDHRHVKRRIRPMLSFKSFRRAQTILAGIELVSMLRKGQYSQPEDKTLSPAEMFYRLTS